MGENRCVCCGSVIPEGSHVCINCQKGAGVHKPTAEDKADSFFWDWLFPIIVVGGIIWLLFFAGR